MLCLCLFSVLILHLAAPCYSIIVGRPTIPPSLEPPRFPYFEREDGVTYLAWDPPEGLLEFSTQILYHYKIRSIVHSEYMFQATTDDQRRTSLVQFERILAKHRICAGFVVTMQAVYTDTLRGGFVLGKSRSISITEVLPFSEVMGTIDNTLRIDNVTFVERTENIFSVRAVFSFQQPPRNCPTVRRYYLRLDRMVIYEDIDFSQDWDRVYGIVATQNTRYFRRSRHYKLSVIACTDYSCHDSLLLPLNTTVIQTAGVTFYRRNVFLTCTFADNSKATGCIFRFLPHRDTNNSISSSSSSSRSQEGGATEYVESFSLVRRTTRDDKATLCAQAILLRDGYELIGASRYFTPIDSPSFVVAGVKVVSSEADYRAASNGCPLY